LIEIRHEQKGDESSISKIIAVAFAGKSYSDGTEPGLVDELRKDNALTLSLVAIDGDTVVGQICFSEAGISSGTGSWYTLGPIAVLPTSQGQGIGRKLIESGLKELEEIGAWGCILVGDPGYYSNHGFKCSPENCPAGESKEHFQIRLIKSNDPDGVFSFHPVFS